MWVSFGRQIDLGNGLYRGLSAAYEEQSFRSACGESVGKRYRLGAIVKAADGPLYGHASIAASYGPSDLIRSLDFNGQTITATSTSDTASVVGRLHNGYVFDVGNFKITPMAELSLGMVHDGGYRETGAGAFSYGVASHTHMLADTWLAVRASTDRLTSNGGFLQGDVEGDVNLALNDPKIWASLPDSLGAGHTVELTSYRERIVKTLEAGRTYDWDEKFQVRMNYEFETGRKNVVHGVGVNFSMKF
jgi:outer membrane autotransporter protein